MVEKNSTSININYVHIPVGIQTNLYRPRIPKIFKVAYAGQETVTSELSYHEGMKNTKTLVGVSLSLTLDTAKKWNALRARRGGGERVMQSGAAMTRGY